MSNYTMCVQYSLVLFLMCTVNVVAMLHHYWGQKQVQRSKGSSGDSNGSLGDGDVHAESLILYESAPTPGPPYVCYVTLPGGSCFGNYKVCLTHMCYSNLTIPVNGLIVTQKTAPSSKKACDWTPQMF